MKHYNDNSSSQTFQWKILGLPVKIELGTYIRSGQTTFERHIMYISREGSYFINMCLNWFTITFHQQLKSNSLYEQWTDPRPYFTARAIVYQVCVYVCKGGYYLIGILCDSGRDWTLCKQSLVLQRCFVRWLILNFGLFKVEFCMKAPKEDGNHYSLITVKQTDLVNHCPLPLM